MNDPLLLIRATVSFASFGIRVWTRLFGPKRAKTLLIGGAAISTVFAIYMQVTH